MTHADFEPSHEQVLLRDSVRDLCAALGHGHRDLPTMRANWARFVGLGWMMAGIPEVLGGLGDDLHGPAIIAGALAAGLSTEPWLSCGVLAPQVLAPLAGQCDDAAGLLAEALAGDRVLAVAADLMTRRAQVRAVWDSDGFRLVGRISVVPGGGFADAYLIPASADGETLLILLPAQRCECRTFRLLDGSPAAEIDLDGTSVTQSDIIARGDVVERALAAAIERTTLMAAADLGGASEAALWQTRDYLKVRRQFGAELASFQALQHRMADMYIGLQLIHSILYGAMFEFARADADANARLRITSACKVLANKRAMEITAQAIQLHGGIGVTEELKVGQYFRRVCVVAGQFGNLDSHLARIGKLLGADGSVVL